MTRAASDLVAQMMRDTGKLFRRCAESGDPKLLGVVEWSQPLGHGLDSVIKRTLDDGRNDRWWAIVAAEPEPFDFEWALQLVVGDMVRGRICSGRQRLDIVPPRQDYGVMFSGPEHVIVPPGKVRLFGWEFRSWS